MIAIASISIFFSRACLAQAGSNIDDFIDYRKESDSSPTILGGAILDDPQKTGLSEIGHPRGLIQLPETTKFLVWVELDNGRLNVIERLGAGRYKIVKRIPASIGKQGSGKETEGDQRTPIGIYRVTRYIPDEELPILYGFGAYPIDYPNYWDRLKSRTGYGIWLHGLPKGTNERPLKDSDGCVVVDNESLLALDDYLTPGETLFINAPTMEWLTETDNTENTGFGKDVMDEWLNSWRSLDSARYLDHYHPDFSTLRQNLEEWKIYKTYVNANKSFVDVEISELSVIAYPGLVDTVSTRFYQQYESSNYSWDGWKDVLWQKDSDGVWKIIYEG